MAVHLIMTFLWAGKVFKNIGVIPAGSVAVKQVVSDRTEHILTYIMTEIVAVILIYLFWNLVFYLINNFRKVHLIFIMLFVLGTVVMALCWPYVFTLSEDNFITYSCAVRLTPDYWHNAYSSYVYGACLLFFPVDFMILLVQWSFYLFAVGYIFFRIEKIAPRLKYLAFLLFLFPSSFLIIRDSYRIFQYLIIALIFVSILLFDIIEKKKRTLLQMIPICFLAALMAVWRSEGILWASALILIYIIFAPGEKLKLKLSKLGIFAIAFLIVSAPQKIGMEKYYGKAYHIVNTVQKLRIMFTTGDLNIDYPGAEDDIAAIDAVIPHEYIAAYGINSYLRYNTGVSGFKDINQFKATSEEANRYIRAYFNIARHNPGLYLKLLADTAFVSFDGAYRFYPPGYYALEKELPQWTFDAWDAGRGDMFSNTHTVLWDRVTSKLGVGEKLCELQGSYGTFMQGHKVYLIMFFVYIAFLLWSFVSGVVRVIRKKDYIRLSFGLFALALLGEFMAVLIVTPAYGYTYFLITNYLVLTLGLGHLVLAAGNNKKQRQ